MHNDARSQLKDFFRKKKKIDRLYVIWSQKSNVNYSALMIMYHLLELGNVTQRQISEECCIPKQSANNIIKSLKNDGYITLTKNEADKRKKIIELTERGREYATELVSPLIEMENSVIDKMGETLINQLIDSSTIYANLLEEEIDRENHSVSKE